MAVTMILELPGVLEPKYALAPRLVIADLPLEQLVQVEPSIASSASHSANVEYGEPTWEDAAWQ